MKNRAEFFAERLNNHMKGIGTNDRGVIRIIATRCEIDLADIKKAYHLKYDRTLEDDIKVSF